MSQNDRIMEYLRKHRSITSLDAIKYIGCTRLSARIAELEEIGNKFTREMITVKTREGHTRVTEYTLVKEATDGRKTNDYEEGD